MKVLSRTVQTKGFSCSPGDPHYCDLAYVYCAGDDGYVVSLSRFPDADAVEIMVLDQDNHETRNAKVDLSPGTLRIVVPEEEAAELCGVAEHVVHFPPDSQEMRELHEALKVIFSNSGLGTYIHHER